MKCDKSNSLKCYTEKIEDILNSGREAGKRLTEFQEKLISKRDANLKILRNIKEGNLTSSEEKKL